MLRKILRAVLFVILGAVAVGAVLYLAGLRVEMDGGGSPHLRFVRSENAQLEVLREHREQQRARAPGPETPSTASPAPAPERQAEAAAVSPAEAAAEAPAARTGDPVPASAPYWTGFRGPSRDGHYQQVPIRTDWPAAGLTPMWKQPAGGGYASFAVAEGRAFTIEQRGDEEVVAAYDVMTGRELWTNAWRAAFREMMGGDGPRATPTWFDGSVYALGGEGELRSLDARTGAVIWRTNILQDAGASNLQWGMAASPLVTGDHVIVFPGGRNGASLMAYDRRTGRRAWSALDDQAAYSSPILVTLAGIPQIVAFSASRLVGLSLESKEVLWEYPWKTQFEINASQPLVIGDNRLFVSSGYGTGAAVIELTPSAGGLAVREVWRNIFMKNQFSSSVLHDGNIYGLDESILACIDAATGERRWKGGRYGYGQIMLASGHLIVLTERGDLALVRATPERHEEIVRFPALEGKTWNHPAIADGILLVRNLQQMAAFDIRR